MTDEKIKQFGPMYTTRNEVILKRTSEDLNKEERKVKCYKLNLMKKEQALVL